MKNLIIFSLLVIINIQLFGQKKALTFNQIFMRQGDQLTKRVPTIKGWYDVDDYLELRYTKSGESPKLMMVNAVTGKAEVYVDYHDINKTLPDGMNAESAAGVNKDYTGFIFNHENDLYYFNDNTDELDRITNNPQIEQNPTFSPNNRQIIYTSGGNLFIYALDIKTVIPLTKDGSDVILNGYSSWVYMEEILGRKTKYKAFWWSPTNDKVAFLRFDDSPVPKFPLVKGDGLHSEVEWQRYPTPGDSNPKVKLGIIDLKRSQIIWVDSNEDKDEYLAFPKWSPDGSRLFYQKMNRGQDIVKIFNADAITGKTEQIYKEKQQTWVNWFEDITFLQKENKFILSSDRQGWKELYQYDYSGKLINKLVDTEWDVSKINLIDEENGIVYFEGTGKKSTETHLFSIDLKGFELNQITKESGSHSVTISPNGSYFIDKFSSITTPTKLDVYETNVTTSIRTLGNAKTSAMDEYALGNVELFTVPTEDGYNLPVKWYLPPNFNSEKKYPVIISVYGGPESKSVKNSWGYYNSPFYYASKDIIYMSIDHRGSGHFGKEVTGQMHRNLGLIEMTDYIEVVKWLYKLQYIDTKKIGISGYSYGGYVVAMALTYGADYFTHGIAGGSVTDWRLYDNVYTERFMDLPETNKRGYDFASVITHADKYKGELLITHGTIDDNVHMQNSLQLIDKFENLNKKFEMMFYPNSKHGVRFPKYYHSMELSLDFWFRHYLDKSLDEVIAEE